MKIALYLLKCLCSNVNFYFKFIHFKHTPCGSPLGYVPELIYIVVLIACYYLLCLSLSHTVTLLVYRAIYVCPCRTLLLSLSTAQVCLSLLHAVALLV